MPGSGSAQCSWPFPGSVVVRKAFVLANSTLATADNGSILGYPRRRNGDCSHPPSTPIYPAVHGSSIHYGTFMNKKRLLGYARPTEQPSSTPYPDADTFNFPRHVKVSAANPSLPSARFHLPLRYGLVHLQITANEPLSGIGADVPASA